MTRYGRKTTALGAALLAVLLLAAFTAAGTAAQTLDGVALGPDGQPLREFPVVLHRIAGGGGAFIATDTTDGAGAFRFELEADSAIYFAALRYDGAMYLGPTVQGTGGALPAYEIRVGPENEAGAVASALSGPGAGSAVGGQMGSAPATRPTAQRTAGSSDTGALLLVGLLALAAAVAFFVAAPRYRHRRTRETLIELAAVENRLADGTGDRERLEVERDRLRERLSPRG